MYFYYLCQDVGVISDCYWFKTSLINTSRIQFKLSNQIPMLSLCMFQNILHAKAKVQEVLFCSKKKKNFFHMVRVVMSLLDRCLNNPAVCLDASLSLPSLASIWPIPEYPLGVVSVHPVKWIKSWEIFSTPKVSHVLTPCL